MSNEDLCAAVRVAHYRGTDAARFRDELLSRHVLSAAHAPAALAGDVELGMAYFDVECAWGIAEHVSETTMRGASFDQWVYRQFDRPASYVYFRDGKVDAVELN